MRVIETLFLSSTLVSAATAAGLTGNWLADKSNGDGTLRRTYFHLKEEDLRITGTIRTTQFFYSITDSSGGPEGFTLQAVLPHGDRRVIFEGKLEGERLRINEVRSSGPGPAMVAHRVPEDEGALPAYIAPPGLHPVPDNGLARTPPMGWNSWNKFATRIDDPTVRQVASAIARNGMRDAGYIYINIDDTWEGERDGRGYIQPNRKFPDMKELADYVHSKGLKLGIYSSPGPNTCEGYEGSYGHEEQDARTYAAWGIDYLKYDWCGARNLYHDDQMQAVYQKMGDALLASGRSIVFSLCQYGLAEVWKWGPQVGGNLWRTTGDIRDSWVSISRIGFDQDRLAAYAGPGHWNDPDMLEIGNGHMSDTEYRTHMSLWSMLAAPLIAGNDVRDLPDSIFRILTNREVIAIDQDPAGHQARRVWQSGDQEVWSRELANGDIAVAIFNRGDETATVTFRWADAGLSKPPVRARDLWSYSDLKLSEPTYSGAVPSHGVVMLRVH
ncbi:MAG TPA: glycoside hydrolase family 27 protein [Bryobacteraceae bacterium]|nr:glycoside hydrolase family 27 protein [Bryobacteraceae bacterium]